jgi:ferredoxin
MAKEASGTAGCADERAGNRSSSVSVRVDGATITVEAGSSILAACDAAGRYVPRLCFLPGVEGGPRRDCDGTGCGLCVVRMNDGSTALACCTVAIAGAGVTTDHPELRALRSERLAAILTRHPHICLSCPDRDGCARDECLHGNPPEARCCDEFGRCELGRLVAFVDPLAALPRRAARAARSAVTEGRIRYEPGLCVGCGRCVQVCGDAAEAGKALEMAQEPMPTPEAEAAATAWPVARPKRATLRESGCTFCGLCVMACPTGALTAPGAAGTRWLASCRERSGPVAKVLPPVDPYLKIPDDLESVPSEAGLFALFDRAGVVLRIAGVADLRRGIGEALREATSADASQFWFELEPLYTQRETEVLARHTREHGCLPVGNDLGDELFVDEAG